MDRRSFLRGAALAPVGLTALASVNLQAFEVAELSLPPCLPQKLNVSVNGLGGVVRWDVMKARDVEWDGIIYSEVPDVI